MILGHDIYSGFYHLIVNSTSKEDMMHQLCQSVVLYNIYSSWLLHCNTMYRHIYAPVAHITLLSHQTRS